MAHWYHCVWRCVRKAFLLRDGDCNYKKWLENRLEELAEIFEVALGSFSLMDNHTHVVLRLDPKVAQTWSDEMKRLRGDRLFGRFFAASAVRRREIGLFSSQACAAAKLVACNRPAVVARPGSQGDCSRCYLALNHVWKWTDTDRATGLRNFQIYSTKRTKGQTDRESQDPSVVMTASGRASFGARKERVGGKPLPAILQTVDLPDALLPARGTDYRVVYCA